MLTMLEHGPAVVAAYAAGSRDAINYLRVVRLGCAARACLVDGMHGQVLAVYGRTFYLADGAGGVVCVGDSSIGDGPLVVTCAQSRDWRSGPLMPGDPARVNDGVLFVGEQLAFLIGGAETPEPAPPAPSEVSALRRGLASLGTRAAGVAPAEGLGRMIPVLAGLDAPVAWAGSSALARAAAPGVHAFLSWMSERLDNSRSRRAPPYGITSLLGLGPGLTPSGDDFMGGAAIALRALGGVAAADDLAAFMEGLLAYHTGVISGAHLREAMKGRGGEVTMRALDALLAGDGDRIAAAIWAAARVGHTSGWDALSGLAAAVAAFLWTAERGGGLPAGDAPWIAAADAVSGRRLGLPPYPIERTIER